MFHLWSEHWLTAPSCRKRSRNPPRHSGTRGASRLRRYQAILAVRLRPCLVCIKVIRCDYPYWQRHLSRDDNCVYPRHPSCHCLCMRRTGVPFLRPSISGTSTYMHRTSASCPDICPPFHGMSPLSACLPATLAHDPGVWYASRTPYLEQRACSRPAWLASPSGRSYVSHVQAPVAVGGRARGNLRVLRSGVATVNRSMWLTLPQASWWHTVMMHGVR